MTTNLYDMTPEAREKNIRDRIEADLCQFGYPVSLSGRILPVSDGVLMESVEAAVHTPSFKGTKFYTVGYDSGADQLYYKDKHGTVIRPSRNGYAGVDPVGDRLVDTVFARIGDRHQALHRNVLDTAADMDAWFPKVIARTAFAVLLSVMLSFTVLSHLLGGIVLTSIGAALCTVLGGFLWIQVDYHILGGRALKERADSAEYQHDHSDPDRFFDQCFTGTSECSAFVDRVIEMGREKGLSNMRGFKVEVPRKYLTDVNTSKWGGLNAPVLAMQASLHGEKQSGFVVFDGKRFFLYEPYTRYQRATDQMRIETVFDYQITPLV